MDLNSYLNKRHIPPQGFMVLDRAGLIQDANNIPIIYHFSRQRIDKTIKFKHNLKNNDPQFKYSATLPPIDVQNNSRLNSKKYWRLSANAIHLEEIRKRVKYR